MPDEADREKLYATISSDTDILMTHGPPLGVLDGGQGCAALRRAAIRVEPRLNVFGHLHSAYGIGSSVLALARSAKPCLRQVKVAISSTASEVDRDFAIIALVRQI
jgi:hypothetical protein